MVIVNNGATVIRDAISAYIYDGYFGSGTTPATVTDTTLVSSISSSIKTISTSKSSNSLLVVHELTSVDANTTTLSEFALRASSGTLITRSTINPVAKDNTKEVTTTTIIFVDTN